MNTMIFTGTLVVVECCQCHMSFAVPTDFHQQCLSGDTTFSCPQGHRQHYIDSDVIRLKYQVEHLSNSVECYHNQATRQAHSLTAMRGHVTRLKNKIAAGHCPACDQHFPNLQKHMADAHPDFVPSDERNAPEKEL